ncbi:FAD-binding oxidoreductase [Streptomyces odontomachi]|uniref:FAD-binding oxidoreductase n=1 Tax=Streptomyces odontomachi TaxID=2944940 RepID=UPI00210C5730|nr:FAD-binding oxidoreductase [Streptomyces sp. ODS25]
MGIGHIDDTAALTVLRDGFEGTLLTPYDPPYDEARTIFNAMIDRRPAVIAQCETPRDVAAAIRYGREHGLDIAVRGGGHSVAGQAVVDEGLVIDLRRMNRVVVDPEARVATVGGGATMSDLDRACQPHDLVTTGGRVSTTGVGGFTLGGGSGWLDRKYGLACDNLLSVDLVTADGGFVRASEDENPELFWALHGGGGNFGVATSFAFRLHRLPSLTAALMLWDAAEGPRVLRAYRDFLQDAPDEIGGGILFLTAPPEEFVPEHLANRLACLMLVTYAGEEAAGRAATAPMLELGHQGGMISQLPYAEVQCMFDDPPGYRNYWSAEYLASFPDEAVDRFCARADDMVVPSPSQHVLFPQGGVAARTGGDFPLPWRQAPWVVHPFGMWSDPHDDERGIRWARRTRADLEPWSTGAVYLNFIGDEGAGRRLAGYGADHYRRLATVKSAYDPNNVFRFNHNVPPDGAQRLP